MVAQEEMNYADDMECAQLLKRFKSETGNNTVNNGDNSAIWNNAVVGNSRISDFLRTYKRRKKAKSYKRRKKTNSVLENKSQDCRTELVQAANQLNDPALKQSDNMLRGDNYHEKAINTEVSLDDRPQSQWRNFVLEQVCQSFSSDDGSIQKFIRDALGSGIGKDCVIIEKEFDGHQRQKYTPTNMEMVSNGFYKEADVKTGIASKQSFEISNKCTFTDKCWRALLSVVISQKFTSLCKLLFENFQGTKDPLDFGTINSRMKNGGYENSPMLFSSDIQQIWRKLESVGTEMVSLAVSLSDLSKSAYHEQVGVPEHNTVEDRNHGVSVLECHSHPKAEQTEDCNFYQLSSCRQCGEMADGTDSLVCDSCEEMYHVSCIKPAVSEIPPKSWYCARCTSCGIRSPHDNCAVCARLNVPKTITNGVDETMPPNGLLDHHVEENSNSSTDNELSMDSKTSLCKICGNKVENGDEFRTCSHPFCADKCYHTRCLTKKQLRSYGSCWYCPSCLCRVCFVDQDDDKIVLCDGCDHAYHIYCLKPPRTSIPRGKWFCRECDAGIRAIRQAKKAHESAEIDKKKGNNVRIAYVNLKGKLKGGESDKGGGGMDMLLTAAKTLNYEENLAAIHMKS